MAGSALRLDYRYDDQPIVQALQRLKAAAGDIAPALRDIGEHLMVSHDQRFRDQVDPDGNPWAPLTDKYKARKKKNPNKILIRDVMLSGTLRYQVTGDALQFGTALIYGATHQFGDPDRKIPARPFLGISASDEAIILDLIQDHLVKALR